MPYKHEKVVSVKKLSKTFNVPAGRQFFLPMWKKALFLKKVSFSISRGEFVALLGPNGAGKTTLVKVLSGVLVPDEGSEVEVLGFTPWKREKPFLKRITTLFGNRSALEFDVPAIDTLLLFKEIYNMSDAFFDKRLKSLAKLLEAEELIEMPVRKMSFGQRMRVELLAAFLHKPELAFLDEPTIGLDPVVKATVREFLAKINRKEGTTILLTTHNLQDVEQLCQRSIVLKDGQVVWDGPTDELKERYAPFKDVETIVLRRKAAKQKEEVFLNRYALIKQEGILKGRISRQEQIPFIKELLAGYELSSLTIKEPELEEIIKELYKKGKK